MLDAASGESLTIILFRDQVALDAYQAFSNEKIAEADNLGGEIAAGWVYSEVVAIL